MVIENPTRQAAGGGEGEKRSGEGNAREGPTQTRQTIAMGLVDLEEVIGVQPRQIAGVAGAVGAVAKVLGLKRKDHKLRRVRSLTRMLLPMFRTLTL